MYVVPLQGLDKVRFGMLRDEVANLLGSPEEVENPGGQDGVSSEIWLYHEKGLELYFDPDLAFRLWGIILTSQEISFEGSCPVGLSELELEAQYPDLVLDVADGRFKEYIYPNKEIEFFLKDGIVKRFSVNPDLKAYMDEFGA